MANFDEILTNLHQSAMLVDTQAAQPIVITSRRAFEIPSDYDLVLGYAGDVNSQLVTFQFPKTHEGHDLAKCHFKKIKWANLTSGTEGVSNLTVKTENTDSWLATWAVPPEMMTVAGNIEIAISIYDEQNDIVAFSWNTPSYRGFSIGASANSIADVYQINSLPAQNEILIVNTETRKINSPVNWNPIICSYGDIGLSKIFFEINQYIRGLNLKDDRTEIYVGVQFINDTVEDFRVTDVRTLFDSESNKKANKVLITWDVPEAITNNEFGYAGNFVISLKIQTKEEDVVTKRWSTSQFEKLTIGPSALQNDLVALVARDEEIVQRVVDNVVDEVIDDKIDDYMDSNYFVIDGN